MRSMIIALMVLATSGVGAADDESNGGKEAFTAVAISSGGPRSDPVAAQVDIVIEKWSTDADRKRLMDALRKGQNEALDVLRHLPRVGFIRSGGGLGWDLHYAHQMRGEDGGRQIFLATDRPISAWEAINRPRTIDYPFTFVELHLNDDGEGVGKLSRATRVTASDDGRFVHLEDWDTGPIDLTEVKPRR